MHCKNRILHGLLAGVLLFIGIVVNHQEQNKSILNTLLSRLQLVSIANAEELGEDAEYKFADAEIERAVRGTIKVPPTYVKGTDNLQIIIENKFYTGTITYKQIANLEKLTIDKTYKVKTYQDLKNFKKLCWLNIKQDNLNNTDIWESIKDLEGLRVLEIDDPNFIDLSKLFQTKAKDTISTISIPSLDKNMLMQLKDMKSLSDIQSYNNSKIEDFDGVVLPYGCMAIGMLDSEVKNIDGLRNYPLAGLGISGKYLDISDPTFKKDYYGASTVLPPNLQIDDTPFAKKIKDIKVPFATEMEENIFKKAIGKKSDETVTYGDITYLYDIELDETKLKDLNPTEEQLEQFISNYLQREDFIPPGLDISRLKNISLETLINKGIVNEKNINYLVVSESQLPMEYLDNINETCIANANVDNLKIKVHQGIDTPNTGFFSDDYWNKIQHYSLIKTMRQSIINQELSLIKNSNMQHSELLRALFANQIVSRDVNYLRSKYEAKLRDGTYAKEKADAEEKLIEKIASEDLVRYMKALDLKASIENDENGVEKIRFTVDGKEYTCSYDRFTNLRDFGITPEIVKWIWGEIARDMYDSNEYYKLNDLENIALDEREYYMNTEVAKPKETLSEMDYFKVKLKSLDNIVEKQWAEKVKEKPAK